MKKNIFNEERKKEKKIKYTKLKIIYAPIRIKIYIIFL